MSKTILHGNLAGSTDAVRMPQMKYQNGFIKAFSGNGGVCAIGSSSDLVLPGTTDTNTTGGWPLKADGVYVLGAPGDLSELWYITEGSTDTLQYILEQF